MFEFLSIAKFSAYVGASEAAFRLLLTVFAGYPLALIHRKYVHGGPKHVKHLFCIGCGAVLGVWNYGLDFGNCLAAIGATYVILKVLGGTALSVAIVFIFNMGHLLMGYYYTGTDDYDINWTMPQCILVLRLIGVAYDFYDGQQPPEKLSCENKKVALEQCPTLLEIYGHCLFPASFIVGPQFSMKRYQDFTGGKFGGPEGAVPDSQRAAAGRWGLGLVYLGVFQVLGSFLSDEFMVSEEFADLGFARRMLLMGLWGRFTLYKYISCWLLTEGACILFGLAYNGLGPDGAPQWNGVANVKLSTFENTTEFTHYIQSFNTNTNHWVAQYIYKRLKFLGNRHISQLAVLLFLAIWHGHHSGYYVCFFFEFIVVYMERDVKSVIKSNKTLAAFFSDSRLALVVHLILRVYTFVFMGWCLLPFALLTSDKYSVAFGNVNHVGTILFVLWPIVYAPLLRLVFKKDVESD